MPDRTEEILEECLELLGQGVSREECLARFPEHAPELELLLRTATAVQGELASDIPLGMHTRVRARVLAEWDRKHQPRRRGWHLPIFLPRWAAVAASLVAALVLGGAGTVAAAGGAVPGDPLYPVKEFREEARLWFARSPEAKVAIYSRLVKERAKELRTLTTAERFGPSAIVLGRLDGHLTALNTLVEENVQRSTEGLPVIDADILMELQTVITEEQSFASVLQETLEEAPPEAHPGLQRALENIQQAQDRVRSALEAVGAPVPAGHSRLGDDE